MNIYRSNVLICGGTGCTSSKSDQIQEKMEIKIQELGLEKEVKVIRTGCFGLCEAGPIVVVYPEGAFYSHVKLEDVDTICEEHLLKGRIVSSLLYKGALDENNVMKSVENVNFYKKQKRVAIINSFFVFSAWISIIALIFLGKLV